MARKDRYFFKGTNDIPPEIIPNTPKTELSGNKEASVEGCCGILEYSAEKITLDAGKLAVSFFGSGLKLEFLNGSDAVVSGKIKSLEFTEKK